MKIHKVYLVFWVDDTRGAVVQVEAENERQAEWASSAAVPPGRWTVERVQEVEAFQPNEGAN